METVVIAMPWGHVCGSWEIPCRQPLFVQGEVTSLITTADLFSESGIRKPPTSRYAGLVEILRSFDFPPVRCMTSSNPDAFAPAFSRATDAVGHVT
jgi:hypothetical protein